MKELHIRIRLVWGEIRRALLYGVVAAILTISLAALIAARISDESERVAQQQTALVVEQVAENHDMLCALLRPDHPAAFERYCEVP